jgi:hypothetical protein
MANSRFWHRLTRTGTELLEAFNCRHLHAPLQVVLNNCGLLNCFSELHPILSLIQRRLQVTRAGGFFFGCRQGPEKLKGERREGKGKRLQFFWTFSGAIQPPRSRISSGLLRCFSEFDPILFPIWPCSSVYAEVKILGTNLLSQLKYV